VVVGLLQYSAAQAEAMAMGAAGLEPDEFSLSKEDVEQFHLGGNRSPFIPSGRTGGHTQGERR
jgi:hypothetical protein